MIVTLCGRLLQTAMVMADCATVTAESAVVWRIHNLNLLNRLILDVILVLRRVLHSMSLKHLHNMACNRNQDTSMQARSSPVGRHALTAVNDTPWLAQEHLPAAACS